MSRLAVSNKEYQEIFPNHRFDELDRRRPVTSISIADAVRFCQLKSKREDRNHRLPSREFWERAHRGPEGASHRYPWGGEYSRYFCNSLESGWGRKIDVSALWQGTTPEGVYNLCGNVFEMLLSMAKNDSGSAIGGSYRSTCKQYGAPPFETTGFGSEGKPDVGFRYMVTPCP